MIIVETCPKCGHGLENVVLCTYPSIPKKSCPRCGWVWQGEMEQVLRIPFEEPPVNRSTSGADMSLIATRSEDLIYGGVVDCNYTLGSEFEPGKQRGV